MDTSKEYIKMCEKATEIQEYARDNFVRLRPLFIYDLLLERVSLTFWVPKKLRERLKIKGDELIVSIEQDRDRNLWIEEGTVGEVIWLPRQDQLQEIVFKKYKEWIRLDHIRIFYGWIKQIDYTHRYFYYSMEQLWLCFLMKMEYYKTWDGKIWAERGGKG